MMSMLDRLKRQSLRCHCLWINASASLAALIARLSILMISKPLSSRSLYSSVSFKVFPREGLESLPSVTISARISKVCAIANSSLVSR